MTPQDETGAGPTPQRSGGGGDHQQRPAAADGCAAGAPNDPEAERERRQRDAQDLVLNTCGLPSRPPELRPWDTYVGFHPRTHPVDVVTMFESATGPLRVATRAAEMAYGTHGVGWTEHAEWGESVPGDRLGIGFLFSLVNAWQDVAEHQHMAGLQLAGKAGAA